MPENKNIYSIDFYIYKGFADYSPYINPNYITYLNILITPIISYMLYYKLNQYTFLYINIFRSLLDIMDGAIARKYNCCSVYGKYLDFFTDQFYWFCIFTTIYLKYNYTIILLSHIYGIYAIYSYIYKDIDIFTEDKGLKIIHDNTIFFVPTITQFLYIIN